MIWFCYFGDYEYPPLFAIDDEHRILIDMLMNVIGTRYKIDDLLELSEARISENYDLLTDDNMKAYIEIIYRTPETMISRKHREIAYTHGRKIILTENEKLIKAMPDAFKAITGLGSD